AARPWPGRGPHPTLRDAALQSAALGGGGARSVLAGVPLPAAAPPVDGLSALSPVGFADRQRRDRGRLQDRVHTTAEACGHALAEGVGPSDRGPARAVPERYLGRGRPAGSAGPRPAGKGKFAATSATEPQKSRVIHDARAT